MTNDIVIETRRKELAIQVIELILAGKSKKDACTQVGIDDRTYEQAIIKYPELLEQLNDLYKSRIAGVVDEMINVRRLNLESLAAYTDDLRERISNNLLDEDAAKLLIKIDQHINKNFLAVLLPQNAKQQELPPPPADGKDKIAASDILSRMTGAKVMKVRRVTETVEIGGEQDYDVVNGEVKSE